MDNDIDIFNLINRQFSKQISKEEEAVLKAWYVIFYHSDA